MGAEKSIVQCDSLVKDAADSPDACATAFDDNLMAWAMKKTQPSTQPVKAWEKARTSTGHPLRLPFGGAGVALGNGTAERTATDS